MDMFSKVLLTIVALCVVMLVVLLLLQIFHAYGLALGFLASFVVVVLAVFFYKCLKGDD